VSCCFSPGSPVFLPPQKSTFPNSNSTRNQGPSENYIDNDVIPVKHGYLFIHLLIYSLYKTIDFNQIAWFQVEFELDKN
jgi:hypothetical protein